MGALQGTLTYKVFYVHDEVPEDFHTEILERVKERAFEELTPESEDDEHYGWVPIEHPLRVEFERFNIVFDHFVNLGLRQDKYAIPSNLLKAHVSQAERAYKTEHDKDRLSKFERQDIKDVVRGELKNQSLPRMKVVDMSWDLRSGRIRFWNQSAKTCELFQGLFEDTFGLKILPANPYINAMQLELANEHVEMLAAVEPLNFAGVATAGITGSGPDAADEHPDALDFGQ